MANRYPPSIGLRSIETSGWRILAILAGAGLILGYVSEAAGLAVGGGCALGSFRLMDIYFARMFPREGVSRPARWWHHALYILRFAALIGTVALAIGWLRLPVVGVVAGLSIPPLAIFIHGARSALRAEGSTRA